MKAFTVYQPYAHAIVAGVKHYETRPRRTHIRGRVAVHAGRLDEVQATKHLTNGEFWAPAPRPFWRCTCSVRPAT